MFSSLMTEKGPDKHPKYPGDSFPRIYVICTLYGENKHQMLGFFVQNEESLRLQTRLLFIGPKMPPSTQWNVVFRMKSETKGA